MLKFLAKFIYFKVMGWKLVGEFPNVDKCVLIGMPHTHWHDFPVGLIMRKILGIEINFIAKKALFRWPYGWFFRWTGGSPVDRSKNTKLVDSVAQMFNERKVFRLALAPEGTREKVNQLRTGFYFIAKKANVPIVMLALDFGKKQIKFSEAFYPSDSLEEDMKIINSFFKGVIGKVPEKSYAPE